MGSTARRRGNEIARTLAVDRSGDILLGGQFGGEVPPDDGIIDLGTGPLRSAGDFDGLLARFSATGAPRWARGFGDVGLEDPDRTRRKKRAWLPDT